MELFYCNSVSRIKKFILPIKIYNECVNETNKHRDIVKFKELPCHAYEMVFDVTFVNVNEYIQIYFAK